MIFVEIDDLVVKDEVEPFAGGLDHGSIGAESADIVPDGLVFYLQTADLLTELVTAPAIGADLRLKRRDGGDAGQQERQKNQLGSEC